MEGNKKIAINTIIIYIRLFIVSIITLAVSRVVLDALGASSFGLYNVVGGLVLLLNMLNSSMASTTYRYLAFELGKSGIGNTNKVFNTSVAIHRYFALSIIVLGLPIGVFYINNYLNVPVSNLSDARFVLYLSIVAAAFNTLSIPFQGLLVAYEKFSISAIIDVFTNIFKVTIVLLFIYSDTNRIRLYSVLMLCYTLLAFISYFIYCYFHHKDVIRYYSYKDSRLFREMLSFSGWTMFGAAANVGKTQGSAIVLNFFFGTIINAAYAVANQVETFILMFSRTINSAAVPQTTKSFSVGDVDRSVMITAYISKYTFLMMTIIAFPILLETDFILGVWLKNVPEGATVFCQLIVLGGLVGCLGEGIPNLINASGKIKAYQVVVHLIMLSGIPISILLYLAGCSPYSITVVYCIINFINSFVKLLMLHRVISFNMLAFMKVSYLRIILTSIPLILFYFCYPQLLDVFGNITGFIISLIYLFIILFSISLDSTERKKVIGYLKKKLINI